MPVPEIRTLDPSKVTLTVNGVVVTGFADGEYIRAEITEDTYDRITGVQGHSVRVRRAGKPGEIRIRLLATSPTLPVLRALAESDKTFPVVCTDSNDGTEKGFMAEQAWIKRPHPFVRAKDAAGNVVEVVFETHHLVFNA